MQRWWSRIAGYAGVTTVVVATLTGTLALSAPANHGGGPAASPSDSAPDLSALLGRSGQLRVIPFPGDSDVSLLTSLVPELAARGPGLHPTGLSAPDGESIHALSLTPLSAKRGSRWQSYRVGFWPGEAPPARRAPRYPLPAGFLEVTEANQDLPLSASFRVRDFLTRDQPTVWPKLLVIELPLLDKLELIAQELSAMGRPASLRIMSGFRTPQYNAIGVGSRGGRARDSQHMYGGAADIYVDADRNGRMDDLDGDGRLTVRDATWLAGVAERVEAAYPEVTGGIGIYRATAAHGPFVHVDVRGTRARW